MASTSSILITIHDHFLVAFDTVETLTLETVWSFNETRMTTTAMQ